jgi:hypothetical protein
MAKDKREEKAKKWLCDEPNALYVIFLCGYHWVLIVFNIVLLVIFIPWFAILKDLS